MQILITLEVTVEEEFYPILAQASSKTEIIEALVEENIINDVIVPELEDGDGIVSIKVNS